MDVMNFTMEGVTDPKTSSRKKSYCMCVCVCVCVGCVCVCVCCNRQSQCQSASPTLIIMPLMVHADSIHFLHLFWQITGARNSPVRMQKCPCTTRQLACCYCTQYTLSQTMSSLFCLVCASVAPPKAVKVLPLPPHPLACNAQCLHQKGKYYTDEIPWWSFSAENKKPRELIRAGKTLYKHKNKDLSRWEFKL